MNDLLYEMNNNQLFSTSSISNFQENFQLNNFYDNSF